MERRVQPFPVFAQVVRLYWRQAGSLILLGVIVFTPLGLVNVLMHDVGTIDTRDGLLGGLGQLSLLSLKTGVSLLGDVFYSGAVALLIIHGQDGGILPLRQVARRLSFGRLIAVDILYAVIVVVGLILLIIPGLILMTWFWLAGAVVEIEDRPPIDALRRSRRLIKGQFWRVFVIVLPLTVLTEVLSVSGSSATFELLGQSTFSHWFTEAFWEILLTPFYALAVILVLLKLNGMHAEKLVCTQSGQPVRSRP